jgi:predicted nucleotidyltransferase
MRGASRFPSDLAGVPSEVVDALHERLAADGGVEFAYLFGSVVKGRVRGESDLDVAVHLPEGRTAAGRLEHALALEGDLELETERPVQVTVLNDAPLELRHGVLSRGILVHVRDDASRRRFFVDTARHYYDMAPARAIFRRYQARRIREGTFGG